MTQLRVAGGGSHYLAVMRDCDGNATSKSEVDSYDVGIGVDHKFGGTPAMLGVNGGYLHDDGLDDLHDIGSPARRAGYWFMNPNAGIMQRRFSISMGVIYFSQDLINPNDVNSERSQWHPTLAMRIGDLRGAYLTFSALSGLPTYTGAGYFDIGGGWTLSGRVSLWAGVNLGGPVATGASGRLQWRMSDRFYSDFGVMVGSREGENQYSGNVGLTYRIIH